MHERRVTIPELILIAGTRVALGAGLGLILGEKLGRDVRKGAGMGTARNGRCNHDSSRPRPAWQARNQRQKSGIAAGLSR